VDKGTARLTRIILSLSSACLVYAGEPIIGVWLLLVALVNERNFEAEKGS